MSNSASSSTAHRQVVDINDLPVRVPSGGDLRQVALLAYLWKNSAESESTGGVGWAGISNVLSSAVQRRRELANDPCQCDGCFAFTAKLMPKRATATQRPTPGINTPAFSHSSTFSNVTAERRQILRNGGGLSELTKKILSDRSVHVSQPGMNAVVRKSQAEDGDDAQEIRTSAAALLLPSAQQRYKGYVNKKKAALEKAAEDQAYVPFVSNLLSSNTPATLLAITGSAISPVSVSCAAKNISWQQQLILQQDALRKAAGNSSTSDLTSTTNYRYSKTARRLYEDGVSSALEWVLKDVSAADRPDCADNSLQRLLLRGYDGVVPEAAPLPTASSVLEPQEASEADSHSDKIAEDYHDLRNQEGAARMAFLQVVEEIRTLTANGLAKRSELAKERYAEALKDLQPKLRAYKSASAKTLRGGGVDGIGMLLHPLANCYRPRSVGMWSSTMPTSTTAKEASALTRHILLTAFSSTALLMPGLNSAQLPDDTSQLSEIVIGRCTVTRELILTMAMCGTALNVLALKGALLVGVDLELITLAVTTLPALGTLILSEQPALFAASNYEKERSSDAIVQFGLAVGRARSLTHVALDCCDFSNSHFIAFTLALSKGAAAKGEGYGLDHLCVTRNRISATGIAKLNSETAALPDSQSEARPYRSIDLSLNNLTSLDGAQLKGFVDLHLLPSPSSGAHIDGVSVPPEHDNVGIGLKISGNGIKSEEVAKFLRLFRRSEADRGEPNNNQRKFRQFGVIGSLFNPSELKLLPECFILSPTHCSSIALPPRSAPVTLLTSLDLTFVSLTDPQSVFYSTILPQLLPSLGNLNLSNCDISDEGCAKLCAAVEKAILSKRTGGHAAGVSSEIEEVSSASVPVMNNWVLQQQLKRCQNKKGKEVQQKSSSNAKKTNEDSGDEDSNPPIDASDANSDGLTLQRLKLCGNTISAEGLRFVVRAVRGSNCPDLEELGLSNLSIARSKTGKDANTASQQYTASRPSSYSFRPDTSGQLISPIATVLRSLVTQVNQRRLVVLDLSGNTAFLSHLPLVEELTWLASSTRAKTWEALSQKACPSAGYQALSSPTEATSPSTTTHPPHRAEPAVSGGQQQSITLLASCRPPIINLVVRNIDPHWETQFLHSGQCSLLFAQCIFS